jgi:hypothetical protein
MYPALGGRVKFFDTKYRLFGVINIIDLVVVLAILVGGYAVYRVLAPKGAESKGVVGTSATFDVVCPSTRNITVDQIRVGDKLYKNSGKPLGTVTAVKIVPTPSEAWDATQNKIVPFASTVFSDVIISASATGQPTDTGFAVGDVLLHSGAPMPVMTSTYDCDTAYLANLKISGQ